MFATKGTGAPASLNTTTCGYGSLLSQGRQSLRRILHLQHTPANLIFLDRFEQRLEIALAKAVVALALDELEEDRTDRIGREDLQQHLCLATIDHALAIDQNAVALQAGDILAVSRQPRIDFFEVGSRR